MDQPSLSMQDRRPSSNLDDVKRARGSGTYRPPGRDHRAGAGNSLSGQVGHGFSRHPRGQLNPNPGGITRVNSSSDRRQRGAGTWRAPIPPPQTPSQAMHKAEKRYQVGKVSDEEEGKQRQLKGILNKLTPENFDRLFQQVKKVNIDSVVTLTGVISQIFDKALMEPTFCEMYASFCLRLAGELPDFREGSEKITFKRLLLSKCQEEFERGEGVADERSAEERERKRVRARRRMLGNIRLIGELYKKEMLSETIMHRCIQKLLGQGQDPDEEDVEALCVLMSTIGKVIDHPRGKDLMDAYFEEMAKLATMQKLSSRARFMLRDAIDLRKNRWQQRRKVEGPKKIAELRRDAAQERHGQRSWSASWGPPRADPAQRGSSTVSSPSSQPVDCRGSSASQDALGPSAGSSGCEGPLLSGQAFVVRNKRILLSYTLLFGLFWLVWRGED